MSQLSSIEQLEQALRGEIFPLDTEGLHRAVGHMTLSGAGGDQLTVANLLDLLNCNGFVTPEEAAAAIYEAACNHLLEDAADMTPRAS